MKYTRFPVERKGEHVRSAAFGCVVLLSILLTTGTGSACGQVRIPAWVGDAVFYQIFPERFANGDTANDPRGVRPWGGRPEHGTFFGGDLAGIIGHLDHIQDLGVTALYLNPIFTAPSNHKYNTTDYMRIDPAFGDEDTFRALIEACHERGIRVILDGVFNHTSVDFFAFADLRRKGERSAYKDWYNVHSFPVGPPNVPNYECWWGYGTMPKLMTGNPAVRAYLFAVTRKWMDLGIDGWRLDVANEVPHDFWVAWRSLVKSINPDAYLCAEIWDNAAPWLKGDEFDGTMNYRFRTVAIDFFASRTLRVSALDSTLTAQRADYGREVNRALLNLLGSHDTERILTMCGGDTASVRQAVLFQMTYPGAPMIYYGDEIGMAGGRDPDCRRTMVWDADAQDQKMLHFFRTMIAVRRGHAVWTRGNFETLHVDDAARVYAYARVLPDARGIVVINDGQDTVTVQVKASAMNSVGCVEVWPATGTSHQRSGGFLSVRVMPRSGTVLLEAKE